MTLSLIFLFCCCCIIAGIALINYCCFLQEFYKKLEVRLKDSNWFVRELFTTVLYIAVFIANIFTIMWIPLNYLEGKYFGLNLFDYYILALTVGMISRIIILSRKSAREAKDKEVNHHHPHPIHTKKVNHLVGKKKEKSFMDEIEERLMSGEKKNKIYADVSSEFEDPESFGWSLSHTPYPYLRIKYRPHTLCLSGLIIIFTSQLYISLVHFSHQHPRQIFLLIFGLLVFAFGFGNLALRVYRYKPYAPFMASWLGIPFTIFPTYFAIKKGRIATSLSLEIIEAALILILGIWLSRKLAPRGVLFDFKAPRNDRGEVDFD